MKTKLTLNIDKATIEKGRRMAKREQRSLSAIVEDLLNEVIEKDSKKKKKIINELHGIAGSVPEETNWKEMIRDAAYEKHGK
ncbi:MAG: DUF6364 family protein [Cyclobacteriaceae bacterium]